MKRKRKQRKFWYNYPFLCFLKKVENNEKEEKTKKDLVQL